MIITGKGGNMIERAVAPPAPPWNKIPVHKNLPSEAIPQQTSEMTPLLRIFLCSIVFYAKIGVLVASETTKLPALWNSSWVHQKIDCQRTNWMHTAKTGSTFCLAIQHVCCPAAFENLTQGITMEMLEREADSTDDNAPTGFRFNEHYCYKFERTGYEPLNCTFAGRPDHVPLYRRDDLTKLMGLLMVREPKSRIISAFLDNVHVEGFANRTSGREMKDKFIQMDLDKDVPHEVNLLKKAQMYVHHHALYGHQVKMLLGLPVLDLSQPRTKHIDAVVARAVERMRSFFFVGIFDEYARSLKVFHELANVGTIPTPVELFPQRRTSAADKAYLMKHLDYHDPYDTHLYQMARKIFQEEIDFIKQWKNVTL